MDHRRIVFMPFSETKNTVMGLPNAPGLFFTTQIVSGGEVVIAYDKTLHKYWAVIVNQTHSPDRVRNHKLYFIRREKNRAFDHTVDCTVFFRTE